MTQPGFQQKIRFLTMDDFTGIEVEKIGTVVGNGKDVRKLWPVEMAEADDDVLLVEVKTLEKTVHFAVDISEIMEVL